MSCTFPGMYYFKIKEIEADFKLLHTEDFSKSIHLTLYLTLYYSEYALHVFDSIMEAGKEYGIRHCGYYAMHAVRIEKVIEYV